MLVELAAKRFAWFRCAPVGCADDARYVLLELIEPRRRLFGHGVERSANIGEGVVDVSAFALEAITVHGADKCFIKQNVAAKVLQIRIM